MKRPNPLRPVDLVAADRDEIAFESPQGLDFFAKRLGRVNVEESFRFREELADLQ